MAPRISTLTLNPTIDLASEAETVHPMRKIRTSGERQDPGGGGVNVSRVVRELGGETLAIILAGGVTGRFLEQLLDEGGVPRQTVPIRGLTRINQTVLERSTGLEYRFVAEGPHLAETEWHAALDAVAGIPEGWLVASGSLPPGVPADFYGRLAAQSRRQGLHCVLDTSGEPLRLALEEGGLEMVKPSIGEFEKLMGRDLRSDGALETAAMEIVRAGKVRMLAITLGGDGALLARAEGPLRLPALDVVVKGAVGAGDSFVAAMTMALADGRSADDAFAWGIAAGAAAVAQAGTAHPSRQDVAALRRRVSGVAMLPGMGA